MRKDGWPGSRQLGNCKMRKAGTYSTPTEANLLQPTCLEQTHSHNNNNNMSSVDDQDAVEDVTPQVKRFVFEGAPIPWKRPKPRTHLCKNNSNGRKYWTNMVDENKEEKESVRAAAFEQLKQQGLFTGYAPLVPPSMWVTLECEFYRPLPQDWFICNQRSNGLKAGIDTSVNIPDNLKPDLDNLVKFIKDALQGVIYDDDKQVVCTFAYKMMDLRAPYTGRTVISWRPFKSTDLPVPLDPQAHTAATVAFNSERRI